MSEAIDNAPECATCDGHCCTSFTLYCEHDGRSWAKKRFATMLSYYYPMLEIRTIRIKDKKLRATCGCTWLIDNKCSNYEDRPDFCKHYPYSAIADGEGTCEGCALAQRIAEEMENTNNE